MPEMDREPLRSCTQQSKTVRLARASSGSESGTDLGTEASVGKRLLESKRVIGRPFAMAGTETRDRAREDWPANWMERKRDGMLKK